MFSRRSIEFIYKSCLSFPKEFTFLHALFFGSMVVLQLENFCKTNRDSIKIFSNIFANHALGLIFTQMEAAPKYLSFFFNKCDGEDGGCLCELFSIIFA